MEKNIFLYLLLKYIQNLLLLGNDRKQCRGDPRPGLAVARENQPPDTFRAPGELHRDRIVVALLILLFLKYLPLASMVKDGKTILLISLMAVITPSATTVVQLAQLYDQDPVYASTINVMTTLVSIITMPLMVMLYLA